MSDIQDWRTFTGYLAGRARKSGREGWGGYGCRGSEVRFVDFFFRPQYGRSAFSVIQFFRVGVFRFLRSISSAKTISAFVE